MAVIINGGNGKQIEITEPTADMFPSTVSGRLMYILAGGVYKVLELMGEGLGLFLGNFLVKFLETIEPELVEYVSPLLDLLLEQENLPQEFVDFLTTLKNPPGQAGAILLSGVAQASTGAAAGSIITSLLAPVIFAINRKSHPLRPGPPEIFAGLWRGEVSQSEADLWLEEIGHQQEMKSVYPEILRPRMGAGDVISAAYRGKITEAAAKTELQKRGFPETDIAGLFGVSEVLLTPAQILAAMHRTTLSRSQAVTELQKHGYTSSSANQLVDLSYWIPPQSDLVLFALREVWRPEVVSAYGYDQDYQAEFEKWMGQLGAKPEWAKAYWRAHWQLPSVTQGFEMLHRNIISVDALRTLLRVLDYPAGWRDDLIKMSYKPFTRVDSRRMYGLGVLDRAGVKRAYLDLGYDDAKAEAMTEFTVRYEDGTGADRLNAAKDLVDRHIQDGYWYGVIGRAEAVLMLTEIDYSQEEAEFIVATVEAKKRVTPKPNYGAEYNARLRSLVEKLYTRRVIGKAEATSVLQAMELDPSEIDYLLQLSDYEYAQDQRSTAHKAIGDAYIVRAISKEQAASLLSQLAIPSAEANQLLTEWEIVRDLRTRRCTEAQYRKGVTSGIIGISEYQENIRGLGYTEYDVTFLTRLMQKEAE